MESTVASAAGGTWGGGYGGAPGGLCGAGYGTVACGVVATLQPVMLMIRIERVKRRVLFNSKFLFLGLRVIGASRIL